MSLTKALILLTLAAVAGFATPISGTLFITGSVQIGPNFADFIPIGGTTGNFNVEPTSTGFFTTVVDPGNSDDGDIKDLDTTIAPVGVPISVMNFLLFDLAPDVSFELTRIENGDPPACPVPGNQCSVNQFTLTQTGPPGNTQVNVGFNVRGNVYEKGVLVSTYTGSFGQTFNNETLAGLLGKAAAGPINSAFNANFNVTQIPEPSSALLMLVGLGVPVALAKFRKARR